MQKHYKFVYDGYKLTAVYDVLENNALRMTFAWQPDSVDLDVPVSMTCDGETYYYVTDGNKNVTALLDADGVRVAKYTYNPFGRILNSEGALAEINPFRFSSEYHDDETGLVYYNYRYYSPELGRWTKRDPIEEKGGVNLYAMVGNNPVNRWDHLGFGTFTVEEKVVDLRKGSTYVEATGNPNGFEVSWVPSVENLKKYGKRKGEVYLVQAISSVGLAGRFAHIDGGKGKTGAPPRMTPAGNSRFSYIDSPYASGASIYTYRITSAAIFVPQGNAKNWCLVDTVYFEFSNSTRKITSPETVTGQLIVEGAPPTSHWNNAIKNWRGL